MITLYRDDDICVTSNVTLLRQVHDLFIKHNKIHTVAVQMKDIWDNKEVWYWLMTAPNLEVGLHGWEHKDYGVMPYSEIYSDIERSINYWNTHIVKGKYHQKPLKKFFPPWNSSSYRLEEACEKFGLTVDTRVGGEVYNFHYWALQDKDRMKKLEDTLSL